MIFNKYAIFLNQKGVKVETVCTDFDEDAVSKLSHYVLEVVDNLIDSSNCWFTVLNPNVLLSHVCSLAVRKFSLKTDDDHGEQVLTICFCVETSKGLKVFESEINELCSFVQKSVSENDLDGLMNDIENWYLIYISYISILFQHYKDSMENIIYWTCLKKKFAISSSSSNLTKSLQKFYKYFSHRVDDTSNTTDDDAIRITDKVVYNPDDTTESIRQLVCCLLLKHIDDPFSLKYATLKYIKKVNQEYVDMFSTMNKALQDYKDFYNVYSSIKNSKSGSLLIRMLGDFNINNLEICECVSILSGHVGKEK